MSGWRSLVRELDAWTGAGRVASFWWRDDDAIAVTPALERLLAIGRRCDTPVALAVIPRDADDGLAARLRGEPAVSVLQHGFAHHNHAPDGARQEEYGPHRPRQTMIDELAEGQRRLSRFARALPVMVAPWNRMDDELLPVLPAAGLSAVSTLGPRPAAEPVPGVRRTNVHADIVDWAGSGGFVGLDRAIAQITDHLRARRCAEVDAEEPTGLMTHHLFHDEGCWRFIEDLLQCTRQHPGARWLPASEAFWP